MSDNYKHTIPELQPCPFCGAKEAKLYNFPPHPQVPVPMGFVFCPKCCSRTGSYEGDGSVAAWNVRVTDKTETIHKDQAHA